MKVIKPPLSITEYLIEDTIFLAGSIEMGVAENWQEKVERLLKDTDFVMFNPRRDDWDSSWKQEKGNLQFREQVEWELSALESCKTIIMYFDINTKSPISLLELGLFARTKKMIVICPDGFYRKGNVDIVCEKYKIKQCNTIEEAIDFIKYGSCLEREHNIEVKK